MCLLFAAILLKPTEVNASSRHKGWVTQGSSKYYYRKGQKQIGLQKIGRYKYYFNLKNGKMFKSRWKRINNQYYYFLYNGRMATKRWIRNTYYVNSKGVRVKNKWIGKRFVGEDGKLIKKFKGGWQKIDGKWYYYTSRGKKKTGWITYRGSRYYLNSDGVRMTRMQKINKKNYYFTSKGVMKSSGWVKSGRWYYYANSKGVLNTKERMNSKTISKATLIEYNSNTLKVRMQKFARYGVSYWTAHVKINNISQMKATLSYGTYGGTRQTTSNAVKSNNAIIGINGSAFSYQSGKPGFDAVMLKNGKIYNKALGTSHSLMAIGWDGTMFSPTQGLSAKYLKRNGVRDTFNFGPILLKNGSTASLYEQGYPAVYSGADMRGKYPRSAAGMIRPGEYVLLATSGPGLSLSEMRSVFKQYGCKYAYNMDGGGSATMSYKGYVLNSPSDGTERSCGDFLLFGN